ncbi:MAG: 50S ribosomal protein L10 [Planctomycetes bacterium]|nr:50S ribosomal protein L10 [Planctomycetota bacterium]
MSKPVKSMIIDLYQRQFADLDGAVLIDIRGITANDTRQLRSSFAKNDVKITVVKNSLARKALTGTSLEAINELIEGPTAVVSGGESVVNVARDLIDFVKKMPNLQIKGAVMEGTVFGAKDVDRLSKFPTRVEAQAQVIQVILSPAGNIISAATSAGNNIASILKTIEEKLEKGEAVTKVA